MQKIDDSDEIGASELSLDQYMTLDDASEYTSVPYQTFIWAHNNGLARVKRTEGGGHTRWIHAFDVTEYMINHAPEEYRWTPKLVQLDQLHVHVNLNIRPIIKRKVKEIAEKLRVGGPTPPIWTITKSGTAYIVEGHHRREARLEVLHTEVQCIEIMLPFKFGRAIAIRANEEHGAKLTDTDKAQMVADHLVQYPDIIGQLDAGEMSRGQLAELVGVSESAVSRALADKDEKKSNVPDAGAVLADLRRLDRHRTHKSSNDAKFLSYISYKALGCVYEGLTGAERKDFKLRIKENASAICADLTPLVRGLIDRRGGLRVKGKGLAVTKPTNPTDPTLKLKGVNRRFAATQDDISASLTKDVAERFRENADLYVMTELDLNK